VAADLWDSSFVPKAERDDVKRLVALTTGDTPPVAAKKYRKVLGLVVKACVDGELDAVTAQAIAADTVITTAFHALHVVVRRATLAAVDAERVRDDLLKVGLSDACAGDLFAVLSNKGDALRAAAAANASCVARPSIKAMNWRTDVCISSSSLTRCFRPQICMRLTLSDGVVRTFTVSVEQFHEMRYQVARLLKNVQNLSTHSVLTQTFKN
jgi:hypothetical protein